MSTSNQVAAPPSKTDQKLAELSAKVDRLAVDLQAARREIAMAKPPAYGLTVPVVLAGVALAAVLVVAWNTNDRIGRIIELLQLISG